MDKNLDMTMIVAIACEDKNGEFHFIKFDDAIEYHHIDFKDDRLIANNSVIHYAWYKSITVCTEETIEQFKDNLLIA
jgi:hypothetical protein